MFKVNINIDLPAIYNKILFSLPMEKIGILIITELLCQASEIHTRNTMDTCIRKRTITLLADVRY